MDYSKQIQKAEEAHRRRNYDFAIELYQQLLELAPDLGDARSGLRRALKERFERKKGGKLLRALGGAMPLATAKTLRRAGRHDACAKACEGYLARNPLDEEGNLLLGNALEDAGHLKSALAVYEFLAEIAPKNPAGLKRAGGILYRQGDHARALEYYERALSADPRDQEALKARKDLAAETALSSTQMVSDQHSRTQIKDKDLAAQLERSKRRHLSAEDLAKELERLESAYADSPGDPDLLLQLADVHEKLRDWPAALDMVERALEYRRESFELVCRRGDLRAKVIKKQISRADKDGDQARAGELERELLEFELEDYRDRVRMHPGDASLRLQHGRRLMRLERLDEALSEFQKANADPRVRREAQFFMASCFQQKGFNDLARKEYEKALEGVLQVDERAKEILYNLGDLAAAEMKGEEARSFYARIYEVDIGYRDVAAKMEEFR